MDSRLPGLRSILCLSILLSVYSQNTNARDEVCVYEEKNYNGEEFCTTRSIANLEDYGWNDSISSLSVGGNANVILYKNANFRGKSIQYSGDTSRLRGGMDNEVSSLKVVVGGVEENTGTSSGSSNNQSNPGSQYPASEGWKLQVYCNCASGKRCYVRRRSGQTEVGACIFECPSGCKN